MSADDRTLSLRLDLSAPRSRVWRCWTESDLLKQWFTPQPWRTVNAEIDLRPGGIFRTVMEGPAGERNEGQGIYLEIIPERKLVWTDAFGEGWVPNEKLFMTAMVTLEDNSDGGTVYEVTVRHWTSENCKIHADMGFEPGWTAAARQLEALACDLAS